MSNLIFGTSTNQNAILWRKKHTHTHTHTHARMHTHARTHAHAHTHTLTHTRARTRTHTYTHKAPCVLHKIKHPHGARARWSPTTTTDSLRK